VTDIGALPSDWATDTALLARILTRLREWNPEPRRRTPGAPQFRASYHRANPTDPPADITLPAMLPTTARPPVYLPAASFRRSVGAQTSESGSSHR
jgi:hypothetical protein